MKARTRSGPELGGLPHTRKLRVSRVAAFACAVAAAIGMSATTTAGAGAATTSPQTAYHFAANGNFSPSGQYLPAADGFNTADVDSAAQLAEVPSGDHAMVFVGMCGGATSVFTSLFNSTNSSKVLGYYLMDEPDNFTNGRYGTYCPPANLKAEADYIHSHAPGKLAWIIDMNDGTSSAPSFNPAGTTAYTPSNTDLDGVALDPYPCRTELSGCSTTMIGKWVSAAGAAGWPAGRIYPVYQAFGTWAACGGDGDGGDYVLPTATQEQAIMQEWAAAGVTNPTFDYAYSWGQQCGDQALGTAPPSLQQVFATHNRGSAALPGSITGHAGPVTGTTCCLNDPGCSTTPGTQQILWACGNYGSEQYSLP